MEWYHWMALVSAIVCAGSCLIHGSRLVRLGKPKDYSQRSGDVSKAVQYSYTKAMSPAKKESAFLHLPTYTAGILYHIGTFLSLFVFILLISGIHPAGTLSYVLFGILIITGMSGIGILIKRILLQKLRALSNPDDYISNLLVSALQLLTAFTLLEAGLSAYYFIVMSLFFLYLPLGKLKHTVYFFAARYHLGFFYGWRGSWPPKHG